MTALFFRRCASTFILPSHAQIRHVLILEPKINRRATWILANQLAGTVQTSASLRKAVQKKVKKERIDAVVNTLKKLSFEGDPTQLGDAWKRTLDQYLGR